jgi:hypothetical protein
MLLPITVAMQLRRVEEKCGLANPRRVFFTLFFTITLLSCPFLS